jgi:serine/threonine protein kinase
VPEATWRGNRCEAGGCAISTTRSDRASPHTVRALAGTAAALVPAITVPASMNATVNHIGQYRILRKIGEGGMGMVFVGEHILLKRRAAIKTLLPALSAQRDIVERFFNEARATSAISDPGVVQIFDFGYHVDGTAYIVMELLEGESLAARIDRLGQLSISDSLRIARQAASSLAAAHAGNIVHRDLKPENLFLIADGEAQGGERTKILDFGICKLGGDADLTHTQTGVVFGTPVYMSPEQCRGAGPVDHRSDIYTLGCVLFHMLTSRPPFECEGAGDFVIAHIQQDPPAPSELVPALPPMVDALVLRCLAKAPDDRFQSMDELQVAIEQVLARISGSGASAVPGTSAIALGEGFRSAHDGEPAIPTMGRGSRMPPRLAITSTPITIDPSHGRGSWSWRRAGLALLLLVSAAVVAVAIGMNIGDEAVAEPRAAVAIPAPAPPPPVEKTVAPSPSEPAPPEPVPTVTVVVPVPPVAGIEPEPEPEPTPRQAPRTLGKPTKNTTRPNIAKPRPAPRRVPAASPTPPSPSTKPAEDLYDTR